MDDDSEADDFLLKWPVRFIAINADKYKDDPESLVMSEPGVGFPRNQDSGRVAFFLFTDAAGVQDFAEWSELINPLFVPVPDEATMLGRLDEIEAIGFNWVYFDHYPRSHIHHDCSIRDLRAGLQAAMRRGQQP